MPSMLAYCLLFTGIAVFFIFIHLLLGRFVRPNRPDAEKKTIYECGEPSIGSSWIQFDLRFYVVALLFVVFDVEMAFFFPWAVVFGKTNQIADASLSPEERHRIQAELNKTAADQYDRDRAAAPDTAGHLVQRRGELEAALRDPQQAGNEDKRRELQTQLKDVNKLIANRQKGVDFIGPARSFALIAFGDILIFFIVLVVGFAYLWKRGDLDWVRSTRGQESGIRSQQSGVKQTAP
jgi:NADH-quinone oxidoreductase subunit A